MVRPAVRTNPSQKRSFSKTLFKPAEFGNVALFLWLGLPSTLLHYENADFWKHFLNRRNLETSVFRFCVSDEDILKTKLFESDVVTIIMSIMWFHWASFPHTQNQNGRRLMRFLNSPGLVWKENIWCVFRAKPSFEIAPVAQCGRELRQSGLFACCPCFLQKAANFGSIACIIHS